MGSAPSSVSVRVKRSSSGGSSTSTVRPGGSAELAEAGMGRARQKARARRSERAFFFIINPSFSGMKKVCVFPKNSIP